ncbi:hypothetical protein G4B88_000995 [Cannabis sativa]|uniref:RNase H type-1 domain-containing protein n=1 Tax=Cannabis sativa TaxID=3483 RepID=A0A7J6FDM6_CANSA|nr:hypothetical protein G4B88_000995 [Cannabis sativa]
MVNTESSLPPHTSTFPHPTAVCQPVTTSSTRIVPPAPILPPHHHTRGGTAIQQSCTVSTRRKELAGELQQKVVTQPLPCVNSGDHPMATLEKNPRDDEVILSLMPNVGPSAAQMLDKPHESVCKSRTPHQYPEPVPVVWNIGLGLEKNVAQVLEGEVDRLGNKEKGLLSSVNGGESVVHLGSPSFVIGKGDDEDYSGKKKKKNSSSSAKKRGRPRKSPQEEYIRRPPKQRGGLGFRKFEDINKALVAKLAWDMVSNADKLWVKIFREKFCHWNSFWMVEKRQGDPSIWQNILEARKTILEGSCTIIANGEDTDIWRQLWIPWLSYEDFRKTMEGIRDKAPSLRTVSDLIIHNQGSLNKRYVCYLFGEALGMQISSIDIVEDLGKDRNSTQLGGRNRDCFSLLLEVRKRFEEFGGINDLPGLDVPQKTVQLVQRAPFNSNILVSDGSFKDGRCGLAVVAFERNSSTWISFCKSTEGTSALDAELQAISMALQWAIEQRWTSIFLFSDCLVAVNALNKRSVPDWKIAGGFFKILNLIKFFEYCNFAYANRDLISGVNDLASQTRLGNIMDYVCVGEGLPPVNPVLLG